MEAHAFGAGVRPDPDAAQLTNEMLAMDDVMATILDETIPEGNGEKVTESGRTMCGSSNDIHGPLARFPESVELASCPRGTRGGTWHTHVTKQQLRNPANSLPDTANVIFGEVDASVVVGTQSAEAVMAASDPDAALAEFQDALGATVEAPEDVVDAVISGQVASPSDARRRVKNRLSPLFQTASLSFSELDQRLEMSGVPAHMTVSFEMVDARHHAMIAQQLTSHAHRKDPIRHPQEMREYVRTQNQMMKEAARGANINVGEQVAKSAIGAVVSRAVQSIL